jgi:ATP/maltotriose-dependent transcriptional regulator MalT
METRHTTSITTTFPESFPPALSPKIMIPRPGEMILSRTRLQTMIDDLLAMGHLWIEGPPGAGKTMLAAGYVTDTALPCAWYEIDLLDSDPISLFSSLSRAFEPLHPGQNTRCVPPDPHPEDMAQPALFAHRFFRALFSDTQDTWLLVLDNLHELPSDSPVHEILHICLQEMPVSCKAILLSRQPAPPIFTRMKTTGRLQTLAPELLRFNRREIGMVMALHGLPADNDENCLEYLYRTTAGWAAGLTLLLKEQNSEICRRQEQGAPDYQELFDYFTGVLFAGLDKNDRALLIRAALLPDIRLANLDLCSEKNCCKSLFQALSRKNFFTYALDTRGEMFQFHPLFREFLKKQAETEYSPEALEEMYNHAAAVLEKEGRHEEAIELLLQAGHTQESIEKIKHHGLQMLARGRVRTLSRWQHLLPGDSIENDPWLLFYFGNASKGSAPKDAITMQEKSFRLFRSREDTRGARLACASLIDSIVSYLSDMSALDPCLDYLEQHLHVSDFTNKKTDTFEDILLANGLFRGLVMRRPAHPDLEGWKKIVLRQGGTNPAIILHLLWTGRFSQARSTLDRIYADPGKVMSQLQLSVLNALEIQYYLITAQQKKCIRAIEDSLGFIRKSRIAIWEYHLLILGAACCLNCGDREQADKYLEASLHCQSGARLLDRSFAHVTRTLAALLDNDMLAADRHQQAALDMSSTLGMPSYATWCWLGAALVALFQGNDSQAAIRFEQTMRLASAPENPWFTCQAHLGLAYMHYRNSRHGKTKTHLQAGFSLARRNNYLTFFFFLPKMMTTLARAALTENIEIEFVQRFIRHWQLLPDSQAVHLDLWPRPLKIFTLGKFAVIRKEKPLDLDGKTRKKPVQLLQALVALGDRQQVSKVQLGDLLWPDSEGDAQAATLKVTLYRLRKILDIPDAIIQKNNWISLNPELCWVDSWQFEHRATSLLRDDTGNLDVPSAQKTLAGYPGDFLNGYQNDPWLIPYRRQLTTLYEKITFLIQEAPAGNKPFLSP